MFLFHTIAKILILTLINFSVNCLPSGAYDSHVRRRGRGIFGPEPKLPENHDPTSSFNDTIENMDKAEVTTEIPTVTTNKKWQVGRVSRKQYEIVNMIWRKTKIFLDTQTTTTTLSNDVQTYLTRCSSKRSIEALNRNRPTESYIEFYYLDEIDGPRIGETNRSSRLSAEYIKNRPQVSVKNSEKFKPVTNNFPFLAFHVNISPQSASTTSSNKLSSSLRDHIKRLSFPFLYYDNYKHKSFWDKLNYEFSTSKIKRRSKSSELLEDYKGETCPLTTQPLTNSVTTTMIPTVSTESISKDLATTFEDRIKFFEIYDRQTDNDIKDFCDAYHDKKNIKNNASTLHNGHNVEKILLQHIDVSIGHHEGIHNNKAKKHVNKNEYIHEDKANTKSPAPAIDDYLTEIQSNDSLLTTFTKETERETYFDLSNVASWSDYPFAAVYVYEPSQVLCDAAAISQHWLITAGSCLSRQHRVEPSSDGQSAFVTYCGAAWRQPERIAYVKYTLVHPKFNPRDRSRRFLYNIGVIQVVGSLMSACPGWAPITLMSHQYTTHAEGSMAAAIGWGLDRYAAIYPDTEIPTHPLMVYNALIYSNNCPGNIGYHKAKKFEPLNVMNNVYCLSLPPYKKEESDPVHGSLLVIGGKLIALYLQEERRGWGEQSAQYTGVWRLIPWVLEVAREPEDIDAFTADI